MCSNKENYNKMGANNMTESIKKSILDGMIHNNFAQQWEERIEDEHTIDTTVSDTSEENSDDVAFTTDGTKYSKKAVLKYLSEKGYQITQANIDLAAKMVSDSDGNLVVKKYRTEKHNNLENATDEDIINYINYKILEEINTLKNQVMLESFVDYKVEVVNDDIAGGTNTSHLSAVLKRYSDLGWKLKSIFTNELGKNSVSVAGVGINSTADQTVLIFERSKFITDSDATKIIKKYI